MLKKHATDVLGPSRFATTLCGTLESVIRNKLKEVSQIDDQGSLQGLNSSPLVLVKHLETTNVILKKDGEEIRVRVFCGSHGSVRLGALRGVVTKQHLPLGTFHVFQVLWFQSQSLREQLQQV